MTRTEYLSELESNLITLPREERDMAVRFYEEYFDEAGPEKEQEVIEELGKPYHLARTIIGETSAYSKSEAYIQYKASKPMPNNTAGVFASLQKPDAFAEQADSAEDIMPERAQNARNAYEQDVVPSGARNSADTYSNTENAAGSFERNAMPNGARDPQERAWDNTRNNGSGMFDPYYTHAGQNSCSPPPRGDSMSAGRIVFWVLMSIFVIVPIVIPTFLVIIAAMVTVAAASVICLLASVIALVSGIIRFAVSIPSAIGFICAALISAGIGLALLSASLAFFFKLLPWTFRKIFDLFGKRRAA